jgi:hypothetical protein
MPLELIQDGSSQAIRKMKERLGGIETEEMRRKGLALVTQPTDIFLVTTVRVRHCYIGPTPASGCLPLCSIRCSAAALSVRVWCRGSTEGGCSHSDGGRMFAYCA